MAKTKINNPFEGFADLNTILVTFDKYNEKMQIAYICTIFDFICDSNNLDKEETLERINHHIIKANNLFE